MTGILSVFLGLLRTLLALGALALVGGAAWVGYQVFLAHDLTLAELREKRAQVTELETKLAAAEARALRLQTANRLLKVDQRRALLRVMEQGPMSGNHGVQTRVEFVELDAQGQPLGLARQFVLAGDVAYVDAWVVKFADESVEVGDPLRAASICLFRRIFGEDQAPSEGFLLDPVGTRPSAYSDGSEASAFEANLWAQFWDYANDPARARQAGIRAAHGEAPYVKLVPGRQYRLELRASGGLSIVPDEATPATLSTSREAA